MEGLDQSRRWPARIVHVVGDGEAGGGTTVVLGLAAMLAERGDSVTVISQKDSYILDAARRVGAEAVGLDFSRRWKVAKLAAALHRQPSIQAADILHCHGARAGLPAALLPRKDGLKRVYTVHGFHYYTKRLLARALAMRAERFCIGQADFTLFVSQADRNIAHAAGFLPEGAAHAVVHNGAEVPPDLADVPKIFDIGYLGRLEPQKNPLVLADIVAAMRPMRPSLCVIGGGMLEADLRARVAKAGCADQFTFRGALPRQQALDCLAQCRTLVLPSLWEGQPLALIEAMMRAVPAVASDVPGNREVVLDGQTGFLAALPDIQGFADRLRLLLDEQHLRRSLGAAGRRRAEAYYAIDRHHRHHRILYERLMADGVRGRS